jgi:hypothetical protein
LGGWAESLRRSAEEKGNNMQPKTAEHRGRRIELRDQRGRPQLLIDGKALRLGQLPSGKFYLKEYAFDWADEPVDLAKRYIDFRQRVEEVKRARASSKEGGKRS